MYLPSVITSHLLDFFKKCLHTKSVDTCAYQYYAIWVSHLASVFMVKTIMFDLSYGNCKNPIIFGSTIFLRADGSQNITGSVAQGNNHGNKELAPWPVLINLLLDSCKYNPEACLMGKNESNGHKSCL